MGGIGSCWPTGVCCWVICVTSGMIRGLLGAGAACWLAAKPLALGERAPNDICQWWYYCRRMNSPKWLLPAPLPPEALKISKWVGLRLPSNNCFGTWGVFGNLQVLFKSRVYVLYSPLTNISPKHKPNWFSKPDILGTRLPSAGPLN